MAIKTVLFQSGGNSGNTPSHGASTQRAQHAPNEAAIASEAAIATNMSHGNIVATYNYDIVRVSGGHLAELAVYKLYLIQVRCMLTF